MKSKYGLQTTSTPQRAPVRKKQVPYLRGPIPWPWIQKAHELPGNSIAVGLVLWHYRALRKSTTFKIGIGDICGILNVSPSTARRALIALDAAGLITIDRRDGQKNMITLMTYSYECLVV